MMPVCMSARWACTSWEVADRRTALRGDGGVAQRLVGARCAAPTDIPEMCTRPRASDVMAAR